MADAGVSAFSVFFMQCASFLEYQRRMQQEQGRNNVQSMFGAHEIPSDNQIRNLLDAVPPQALEPLYDELLEGLIIEGVIERYRTLQGKVLLALDGENPWEHFAEAGGTILAVDLGAIGADEAEPCLTYVAEGYPAVVGHIPASCLTVQESL